ncbi:MAG: thiamine diphosphokinase [Candidatus Levybacteria bacterium]|nr:thiamine diphosphokinase [Candidatus Levybacteria bacterium]
MKRAVIFLNGNRPPRDLVFETIKTTDTIICANGGSKHAVALGVVPNVIIGDQDSLPKATLRELKKHKITWIHHPKEKDETDSELAIHFAREKGYTDIIFFGFVGSRIDHMMATLLLLSSDFVLFDSVTIIDVKQTLHIVRKHLALFGEKGEYVSLVPLLGDAKGVTTRGLKWKLRQDTLRFGKTRGVSNEIISQHAAVSVERGVLLVMHTRGKAP